MTALAVVHAPYEQARGIANLPLVPLDELPTTGLVPNAVIVGVPFDGGTSGVAGARHGPEIARVFSRAYPWVVDRNGRLSGVHDLETGAELLSGRVVVDGGDLLPFPLDPRLPREQIYLRIVEGVSRILELGAVPVLIGGDHSVTAAALSAVVAREPEVGVVIFDAHLDYDGATNLELKEVHHANLNSFAVHHLDLAVTVAGVRDTLGSEAWPLPERLRPYHSRRLKSSGPADFLAELPYERVYISVDLDVLDPLAFSATGHPIPGGISYELLTDTLTALAADREIVGLDLAEFINEPLSNELSGLLISSLIVETLASARSDLSPRPT